MTKFLISIRNPREARLLARYPVGVVDLKDPGKGGLGRLETNEIPLILSHLDDSVTKSIAFGELLELMPSYPPDYFTSWAGLKDFAFVKFGLAGLGSMSRHPDWKTIWLDYHSTISSRSSLVAVFYSDWKSCDAPGAYEIMDMVCSCKSPDEHTVRRAPHLLIDTFEKSKGSSVELLGWAGIESLIQKCKDRGIKTVVAGSVGLNDIDQLISLAPDYIGLRGAICRRGREELDEARLSTLFSAISL